MRNCAGYRHGDLQLKCSDMYSNDDEESDGCEIKTESGLEKEDFDQCLDDSCDEESNSQNEGCVKEEINASSLPVQCYNVSNQTQGVWCFMMVKKL